VTIIGHSMGGVMARSIALRRPHTTRHVITLGSPLSMTRGRLPDGVRLTAIHSPPRRGAGRSREEHRGSGQP
jgi:pimeloyl-ACP methyl ester carboxylesterase